MSNLFVDTNIFLRYLTADGPVKYKKCREVFEKAVNGEISLLTSHMVIEELIWTLESFYKIPKEEVIDKVFAIINTSNLSVPDKTLIVEALTIYGRKNIDYIDAYNAVFMKHHDLKEILSYDRDFENFDDIKRIEPCA